MATATLTKPSSPDRPQSVLWMPSHLGDAVMALPALEAFCRERGVGGLPAPVLVARPAAAALLKLCAPPHTRILETSASLAGFRTTVQALRALRALGPCPGAVLAEGFRSALIMRLGGVAPLAGKVTDHRALLLTRTLAFSPQATAHLHRKDEYATILGVDCDPDALVPNRSRVSEALGLHSARAANVERELQEPRPLKVGLFPGAARGPAKVWPLRSFCETLTLMAAQHQLLCTVFGTAADYPAGEWAREQLALPVENLCGQTPLPRLMTLIAGCDLVLANDSGGAHLAGLMGTPVVVIFGATDPARTAPLGEQVAIVSAPGHHSERIARSSNRATEALARISPESVARAALDLGARARPSHGAVLSHRDQRQ